jgi:hypothetical protein
MDANRLLKNFAGRRCEQKAPRKRFLAQPDGQHGLGRLLRSQHSFSAVFSYQRHPWYPREKQAFASISVHSRFKI